MAGKSVTIWETRWMTSLMPPRSAPFPLRTPLRIGAALASLRQNGLSWLVEGGAAVLYYGHEEDPPGRGP